MPLETFLFTRVRQTNGVQCQWAFKVQWENSPTTIQYNIIQYNNYFLSATILENQIF